MRGSASSLHASAGGGTCCLQDLPSLCPSSTSCTPQGSPQRGRLHSPQNAEGEAHRAGYPGVIRADPPAPAAGELQSLLLVPFFVLSSFPVVGSHRPLPLQPVHSNGSMGLCSIGSNASHEQFLSIASSSDSNGLPNEEAQAVRPVSGCKCLGSGKPVS